MGIRVNESNITEYMSECVDLIKEKIGTKGRVEITGLGIKEKKPSGFYPTNKANNVSTNPYASAVKIVDVEYPGTLYVVIYSREETKGKVEKIINSMIEKKVQMELPGAQIDDTFDEDLGYVVKSLKGEVNHVRRVKTGPKRYINGSRPNGLSFLKRTGVNVGAIAVKDGYSVPINIQAFPGQEEVLEKKVRNQYQHLMC